VMGSNSSCEGASAPVGHREVEQPERHLHTRRRRAALDGRALLAPSGATCRAGRRARRCALPPRELRHALTVRHRSLDEKRSVLEAFDSID
jgi:hypothetical protein